MERSSQGTAVSTRRSAYKQRRETVTPVDVAQSAENSEELQCTAEVPPNENQKEASDTSRDNSESSTAKVVTSEKPTDKLTESGMIDVERVTPSPSTSQTGTTSPVVLPTFSVAATSVAATTPSSSRPEKPLCVHTGTLPDKKLGKPWDDKELLKLKKFFATLLQFGKNVSNEVAERVRFLIIALVSGVVSVEEFHQQLREYSDFTGIIRPFVIPFLKANLRLLQCDVEVQSRAAQQSSQQYLRENEAAIFGILTQSPNGRPHTTSANQAPPRATVNPITPAQLAVRTRIPDNMESPAKRTKHVHQTGRSREAPPLISPSSAAQGRSFLSDLPGPLLSRSPGSGPPPFWQNTTLGSNPGSDASNPDEWRQLDANLAMQIDLADRARRQLVGLRERQRRELEEQNSSRRREASDVISSEVKRRTDEAIAEVKRKAMHELQSAVAAAELKAKEVLAYERCCIKEEALKLFQQQDDSPESCQNCGRLAADTCSGCGEVRYCGSFCQHRHWPEHQKNCVVPGSNLLTASDSGKSSDTLDDLTAADIKQERREFQ